MVESHNRAEDSVRQLEAMYVNLVEHCNDGIIIIQNSRLVFVNRKMIELTAYSMEEVIGKPFVDFITPCYKQTVTEKYRSRMSGEEVPERYAAEIAAGDGTTLKVEINASLIDYKGNPATMAVVRDTAELTKYKEDLEKLVEQRTNELAKKNLELQQTNLRLQEVDRLKSVFLASMSHELRTPLNSIIGFTGIILQGMTGPINDEQKIQLTMVKNSAGHLLELINDIIDMSKIEAGKADLSLEEFKFNDAVKEVIETYTNAARVKDLTLLAEISGEIILYSDRRRIKQILSNLINNAIKFTDKGTVRVVSKVTDSHIECSVFDTGKGIAVEEISLLFQPFHQVDISLIKKYQGTGLGLYLCKKLLDLLGGSINVKSENTRGSEFTFTVPLKRQG
jgi:PAS domain S-box-containing protein